jgi:cell division protein FtsW
MGQSDLATKLLTCNNKIDAQKIAEEIGFVGSLLLLCVFLFIIWRGFRIAKHAHDPFGQLLSLAIVAWFGFQTVINIGAIVKIMPLTGVPLPLISSGGSSMVVLLSAFGILLNISRYRS